jgi:hypothetical protein
MLSQFRETATPPPDWDGTHGITVYGMDGNSEFGDCGPAATDHYNVAKTGDTDLIDTLGGVGPLSLYFQYGVAMGEPGPEPDEGVDNASWLGFLYRKGIIDGYGEVPLDQIREYAVAFNGVLIACLLGDDAEQNFSAGIPWDESASEPPDPNDGHDVLLVEYAADGTIKVVTWGALQEATPAWVAHNITDAWVILDADDAKRAGVNWSALTVALTEIHGTDNPAPGTPPPTPAPSFFGAIWAWLRRLWNSVA